MLAERELTQLEDAPGQNYFSFVEPAKWTVISTGVVIWAVRLGTSSPRSPQLRRPTSTSTPWTVIHSVKDKLNSDDNVTKPCSTPAARRVGSKQFYLFGP